MRSTTDHEYMAHALRLAARGLYTTDPNPRVGCVIVSGNDIIGEGWHMRAGEAHAEVAALARAGTAARGATAYVTLEPCCHHGRTPPCTDALIGAGVARVVIGMEDPNPQVAGNGIKALEAAGIRVTRGVLAAQAESLNPGFVSRMRSGRPFVRSKLAMSLDGRTAMASGESQWITGAHARGDVQRLRARASAVLSGIGTVLADDPSLNARLEDAEVLQPLRVILDSRLQLPPTAKLLGLPGHTLVLTGAEDDGRRAALVNAGAEVVTVPLGGDRLDLTRVMQILGEREINEVHVEAGAVLNGALLQAGLVDELVIYLAPHLMGDAARGLFSLPGLTAMNQRIDVSISDIRAVGEDWRITATVN
ncbi:MAG TPA: bifunctional diaminohydroxyphosphoribosylaminopyrimidine deaminase/5-amino-6-(5-phosphoribosylamino)uracil reductase RibD [Gammaproteobacteria bacterium]|jgi:diaminohydroxyphosphoribosylaminopyrimidine deaminase/5-amino-6-(5-phosphoribosylamino)uracil reductase|nr:bifunctional diaminohydroxyphosphoribosylaminopyrimidine deaminase/5-amino-6-(5-phosphoribosylamino)uracil reductase RibD [Gammaproteobacteria bacterium]